jgi:molybdate transport system permease protein
MLDDRSRASANQVKVIPEVVARRSRFELNRPWRLLMLPYLFFILIPLLALLLHTPPASMWTTLQEEQVGQAIILSLVTSLSTVILTVLIGTPVAYYLSHRYYRLFRLVDTLVELPTVLPPAVAGVALLMAFGRRGLLGVPLEALGISIPFTQAAVIMAQTFVAAPFYIKSAALGFNAVDCELKKAAALDGANRWQTFRHIMVPMAWMPLLSGAIMTWARALGEFGATIIFAGNFPGRTQTMPLAIYIGFEINLDSALTLSVILIGFSFLILLLLKVLLQRRMTFSPHEVFD